MSREELAKHWPIAGLAVRTPRVELRWPDDTDLCALADLAAKGVHDPSFMPFTQPWTRRDPGGDLERGVFQFHWRAARNVEHGKLELQPGDRRRRRGRRHAGAVR